MKVIEIIPHLQSGGGEKFVVDLSNEISDKGHDCTIATLYDPNADDILREFISNNVGVHSFGKKNGFDISCVFRLFSYIRKNKPDAVHLHLNAIIYVILAAILYRKCNYFATIHSEAKREAGSGFTKWIRKFLFKTKLVKPITISDESEMSFEKFYGYKATTITNGCSTYDRSTDTRKYLKYRNDIDFLFVHAGRIHAVKNQEMLVKAFERCISDGYNIRLLIAGRVTDDIIYRKIEGHLSDKIIYLGETSDVRAIMSVADAFCLSSIMEGMPITIIEAMSVGCVPICTPVGGCINMIEDGINGFLSIDTQVESYASKIKKFCDIDKTKLSQIKEQCKSDFAFKYSISKTAENY